MIQYFKEENIAIDGKSINSTVSSCHDSKQCKFSVLVKNLIWHVSKLENGKSSEITKVQYLIKKIDIIYIYIRCFTLPNVKIIKK